MRSTARTTRILFASTYFGFVRLEVTSTNPGRLQRAVMRSVFRQLKPLLREFLNSARLADEAVALHVPRGFDIPPMGEPLSPAGKTGFAIRIRRLELGMTQAELAKKAHVQRTHLSVIERGLRMPQPLTLARIEAALGGLRPTELSDSPAQMSDPV